jgi:hypothetical protein
LLAQAVETEAEAFLASMKDLHLDASINAVGDRLWTEEAAYSKLSRFFRNDPSQHTPFIL